MRRLPSQYTESKADIICYARLIYLIEALYTIKKEHHIGGLFKTEVRIGVVLGPVAAGSVKTTYGGIIWGMWGMHNWNSKNYESLEDLINALMNKGYLK